MLGQITRHPSSTGDTKTRPEQIAAARAERRCRLPAIAQLARRPLRHHKKVVISPRDTIQPRVCMHSSENAVINANETTHTSKQHDKMGGEVEEETKEEKLAKKKLKKKNYVVIVI